MGGSASLIEALRATWSELLGAPATPTEIRELDRALGELGGIGATSDELRERIARALADWSSPIHVTPRSIVRHWTALGRGGGGSRRARAVENFARRRGSA